MIKDNHAFIFLLKCYMIIICWVVIHLLYCCVGCNMKNSNGLNARLILFILSDIHLCIPHFLLAATSTIHMSGWTGQWLPILLTLYTSISLCLIINHNIKRLKSNKSHFMKSMHFYGYFCFLFQINYPWNKFLCLILLLYITG